MNKVRFGDVVSEVKLNVDRSCNPYAHYVAGDHMDSEDLTIHRYGNFATDDVGPAFTRIFKPGQILYGSRRTYLKKVAVASFEGICANTTFVLESKDESVFDNRLLPFVILSDKFTQWSISHSKGSTNPYVLFSDLASFEFTLPPIEEQRVLADKLWAAYKLKESYKSLLVATDEMVKSQFIELFGDPGNNSKNLPELTLPELGEFGRGVSKHRPRNDPKLLGGKYPLIQTGEVANSELYITNYENTYSELGLKQSKMWQAGTLCITIAANIAKTAILTFDACFPDSVVGFKANDKTNNIFIHYWFSFFQAILEAQAPESAQKNINLKILSELKIIVPPIEQQNEFVAFVEQTDKSKLAVQQSLEKLETLKKSLMQEYFG